MKILIIIPKYNGSFDEDYNYNFPIGLAFISTAIKRMKKHSVTNLNLNHYKGHVEELVTKAMDKVKYDVVCTGGNTLSYHLIKKVTTTVQNHASKPILILGGPIITSEPETMFKLFNPDYAVAGEGDITIIELLNCIEKKDDLRKVNGIIFKEDDEIVMTKPREQVTDIDNIPFPDFEDMEFEKFVGKAHCNDNWLNQVFDYPRVYPLLGSRGCPFNCTFCWHPLKYRARSIKNIMGELKVVIPKYKINYLNIHDDCFSADKKRLYEFCREIKKFKEKIDWDLKWCCQLLVNTVDEGLLKTLKDAGCDNICYGFESYSPTVLKSMNKPITPEQIDKAIKWTLKANIGFHGNFLFGDIAETKETAKETLDYWKSSPESQQISLGWVEPYPRSKLYLHCLEKGIIKDKVHYIQHEMGPDLHINMTDAMSDEEYNKLNKEVLDVFRKHFKFITPKSLNKTGTNIYEFDFECPYCNETTHYKNCYLENKHSFGFHLICRKCHMRSVLVSPLQKIAYKYYTKTRKLRDLYVQTRKTLRRKRI